MRREGGNHLNSLVIANDERKKKQYPRTTWSIARLAIGIQGSGDALVASGELSYHGRRGRVGMERVQRMKQQQKQKRLQRTRRAGGKRLNPTLHQVARSEAIAFRSIDCQIFILKVKQHALAALYPARNFLHSVNCTQRYSYIQWSRERGCHACVGCLSHEATSKNNLFK